MKELPILFSAPMVRSILENRKTQTRRVMKPQPHPDFLARGLVEATPQWPHQDGVRFFMRDGLSELVKCPHGKPGSRLWVKETAIIAPKRFATPDDTCIKDADGDLRYIQYIASQPNTEGAGWYKLKKTPSIFMPRWASRITLEVESVRVERLNDISESDAIEEGITWDEWSHDYIGAYRKLWESINGPGSWDANPWVWVIAFRKL